MSGFTVLPPAGVFALALLIAPVSLATDEIPGVPEDDSDVADVRSVASYLGERAFRACVAPICVKGSCRQASDAAAALRETRLWLARLGGELAETRKLYTDHAYSQLLEARFSQEKVDELRRLQLLQDALQVAAKAAAEAASWQDFIATYGEKAAKTAFADRARFIADHLKRLKLILQLPGLGKEKSEKSTFEILLKFSIEASVELEGIQRKIAAGGLKDVKSLRSIGKLLKKIGDLWVSLDREARRKRIRDYTAQTAASHTGALARLEEARRINNRIAAADAALAELRRAYEGLRLCAPLLCDDRAFPALKPVETADQDLETVNRGVGKAGSELRLATERFEIKADYRSRLFLNSDSFPARRLVRGGYDVAQICVPEDARFRVFRAGEPDPVLDLGPRRGPTGTLAFRVLPRLQGAWRDGRGRKFDISVDRQDITLVQRDTPQEGRNRVYQGILNGVPSLAGGYVLALASPDGQETYLSQPFAVTGAGSAAGPIALTSSPTSVADLNPKLPEDIKNALLIRILSDRLSYRVELRPKAGDGLSAEFWTYTFKWGRKDRRIVPGSLKPKAKGSRELRRVEP